MVNAVLQDPESGTGSGEPKMDVFELVNQLLQIAEEGEGNIETLLSEEGVNINAKSDEFRETPLHLVSYCGNEEIAKALLKHKADVNIQDVDGWTPLHYAAINNNVSIVNLLLSLPGPPPDARATTTSSTKRANMKTSDRPELRQSGIKVDIPNHLGRTPLHIASSFGYQDTVAAIVQYKTGLDEKDPEKSLDKTDDSGRTALYLAAAEGHARVVKEIARTGASLSIQNETALHVASEHGHREVVQVLLESGADVMARKANERDELPLHLAARNGFTEVIEELLDTRHQWSIARTASEGNKVKSLEQRSPKKGSVQEEIRARTRDGDTALHLAAATGSEETVKKLLEKVDEQTLEAVNGRGETALHLAAATGYEETVEKLLEKVNEQTREAINERGETALHIAAKSGFVRVVRSLIGIARVNKATGEGNTALHLAAADGHTEVVAELLRVKHSPELPSLRNEAGDMALHLAAKNGHTEVIAKLLGVKNHSEVTAAKNKAGDMALHLAAANGYPEVVAKLLRVAKGSDVAISKNKAGHTVLSKAIDARQWESARMTLEKILKTTKTVDLGNLDFGKALISAARQSESHEIVRLLLMMKTHDKMKKSADVQADRDGSTKEWRALHWAAYYGRWKEVWWLLHTNTWTPYEMSTARATCLDGLHELSFDDREREGFTFFKNEQLMRKLGESTEISGLGQAEKKQRKLYNDGAGAKEPNREESYFRALDMLNDPPLVQASDPEERYESPKLNHKYEQILGHFNATIVDFYRQGGHSGFLRQSRKVPKVIYHDGPDKIMEEARSTLGEIDEDIAKKHFSIEDLQFRWIHLPANNLEWMKDLTQRIYWDGKRPKESFQDINNFIWQSWYELPEGPSEARYMKAGCKKDAPKAGDKPKSLETTTEPGDKGKDDAPASGQNEFCKVALYMPYVTFAVHTSEEHLETQRSERFRKFLRNYSENAVYRLRTPDESHYQSPSNTKELDGYERYRELLELYEEKIIHGSRTLDESYYESLSSIKMRNEDQVVTRYFDKIRQYSQGDAPVVNMNESTRVERESNVSTINGRHKPMKILRVDQLWLWVIDDKTILTSSTHRQDNADDPVIEKIFSYLREEKIKGKNRKPLPSTADEMSRFIPKFCIGFFNYCNWKNEFHIEKSIHQIFACSINEQADLEALLFKNFTEKMATIANKIEVQKGSKKDKSDDKVTDRAKQEAKSDNAEDITADEEQTFTSLGKAADQLLKIKDIRDELNMLNSVVKQQKKAWDELIFDIPESKNSPADYTIEHIEEMESAAFRIQEAILAVMGLEQNEASINEAVLTRKQTRETIEQGRTLMVFTVITIIFLPLSFLASLFALNIGEFPHTSGTAQPGTLQYEAWWIFPKIFGVTAGIFVFAIAIGFHEPLLRFWRDLVRRKPPGSYGGGPDHDAAGSSSTSEETSLPFEKPERVGISKINHRSLLSWSSGEAVGGRRDSTARHHHHYHHVRGGVRKALSQRLDEKKKVPGTFSRVGSSFRWKDQTKRSDLDGNEVA